MEIIRRIRISGIHRIRISGIHRIRISGIHRIRIRISGINRISNIPCEFRRTRLAHFASCYFSWHRSLITGLSKGNHRFSKK